MNLLFDPIVFIHCALLNNTGLPIMKHRYLLLLIAVYNNFLDSLLFHEYEWLSAIISMMLSYWLPWTLCTVRQYANWNSSYNSSIVIFWILLEYLQNTPCHTSDGCCNHIFGGFFVIWILFGILIEYRQNSPCHACDECRKHMPCVTWQWFWKIGAIC